MVVTENTGPGCTKIMGFMIQLLGTGRPCNHHKPFTCQGWVSTAYTEAFSVGASWLTGLCRSRPAPLRGVPSCTQALTIHLYLDLFLLQLHTQ